MTRVDLAVAKAIGESKKREPKEREYSERFRPECLPVEVQLVDAQTAGRILGGIKPAMIEKLRRTAGLPAIDLAAPSDPEKQTRHKALYRYSPAALREWWQRRQEIGR